MKKNNKGFYKSRKVVISLVSLLMLIALALSAIGAPHSLTLNTLTLQENTVVNVSTKTANDGSQVNISNIALFGSSSLTANSSSRKIFNITNTTATNFDLGYANITIGNDVILEDANNYAFTSITTGVGDSANVNLSSTTVTVDRTAPSAPTGLQPTNSIENSTVNQAFTVAVNGANTTGCTLRFDGKNPGSSAYVMTHSGDECTLTINGIAQAAFSWYATATDSTNTSANSATNKFTITDATSNVGKRAYAIAVGGGATQAGQQATKKDVALAIGSIENRAGQAGANFGQTIKQELTDKKELTKTGIGIGTGAVAGMAIGTLVMPGIGTVAGLPVGAFIGGFIGALA